MKRRILLALLGLGCAGALAGSGVADGIGQAPPGPLATIPSLDVARYLGTWHELAKFPNWFQRKCVSHTRAEYRLVAPGELQVINRCTTEGGETIEAIGTARQLGTGDSPKLEVRFAPDWLSFIPTVWGDYWVVDLDDDYQLAAVSEPRRKYLWILSRTPGVDPGVYQALLKRLEQQGFDLSRLEPSRQE